MLVGGMRPSIVMYGEVGGRRWREREEQDRVVCNRAAVDGDGERVGEVFVLSYRKTQWQQRTCL